MPANRGNGPVIARLRGWAKFQVCSMPKSGVGLSLNCSAFIWMATTSSGAIDGSGTTSSAACAVTDKLTDTRNRLAIAAITDNRHFTFDMTNSLIGYLVEMVRRPHICNESRRSRLVTWRHGGDGGRSGRCDR